ncbi:MAG: FkbM family methyltransferase [Deltaproteobacteria bacterium]|nr:FkbM family methyltransferase [Deltaproteobacteria bacterium]
MPDTGFLQGRQVVEKHGFRWWLHPDQLIDLSIQNHPGGWEHPTTAAVRRIIQPGWVCLDVGANIGYYTVLFSSLVGATGRVIALEPMEEPMQVLREHLRLNQCVNVQDIQAGADWMARTHKGDLGFGFSWPVQGARVLHAPRDLQFVTIDGLCFDHAGSPSLPSVNLIKIDVDGYELRAILGATRTLLHFRPVLVLELCEYTMRPVGLGHIPNNTRHVDTLVDLLSYLGYQIQDEESGQALTPEGIRAQWDLNLRSINVICIPQ